MKVRILWFVSLLLFVVNSAYADWTASPGKMLTDSIAKQGVTKIGIDNQNRYKPIKGGIKVCKAENKLIVAFQFSDKAIEFFQQSFDDGERKLLGIEIDVVDYNGVFPQVYQNINNGELPYDGLLYQENHLGDQQIIHTVGINNPGQLQPNVMYHVTFNFASHNDVSEARFEVKTQLVADLYDLQKNHEDIYKKLSLFARTGVNTLWLKEGHSQANDFFGVRFPDVMISDAEHFFGWPEGHDTGYDRITWRFKEGKATWIGDYKPYHCGFGSDPWDSSSGNSGNSGNGSENSVEAHYTPPTANYTPNGTGAVEHPQPGERDKLGHKHKVGMDDVEVTITGEDDYHHSLTFYQGEVPVVNVRARLKNKTNQKTGKKKVKIKWFESPNKTFNPDHDHHFATDCNRESIGAFKHNSHDDELVERKTNITHLQNLSPGVYYLYPVFYFEGEENIAAKHDHGEYIKITILPKYDVEAVSLIPDKIIVLIGESFTLTAGIFNNHSQLPHDVRVGFYINGEDLNNKLFYAKVLTASELINQQIITIPVLAPLKPGMYNIAMKVDDEGMLTEINEGNNQRSFNLLVMDNSPPTVDITGEWNMVTNGFNFQGFFFQEGNIITGYMVYDNDQKPRIISGIINEEKVVFFRNDSQWIAPQQYITTYLDENYIAGNFSHNNQWRYTWEATRKATLGYTEDLSGIWRGETNGFTATLILNTKNNLLKGEIKFDVLSFTENVTGIIDGNTFTFFRKNSQLLVPQEFRGTFDGLHLNGDFSHNGIWGGYSLYFTKQ